MDPQLIINLFIQVPALGVVVYLVIYFLKYIEKLRQDDRQFVSELVVDYKKTLITCEQTIIENTKAVQTFNDSIQTRNIACPMMNPTKQSKHHQERE